MEQLWDIDRFGEKIAVITDDDQVFTYKELGEKQNILVKKLKERTVAIICCENTLGSLLCYLSCMKKGVVPLLLPMDISNENLNEIIDSYKPEYLCISNEKQLDLKSCKKLISIHDYIIWYIWQENQVILNEELALLLTTSGSTGNSKCVRLSNQNILKNTESICKNLNINTKDRAITSLPMNYTYGLSVLHTHLYMGAVILLTKMNIVQKKFWDFFEEYKGTSFSGVPFMYECLYKFRIFKRDYPSLKVLTQAGGRLSSDLQKYFADYAQEKNIAFYIMYGQTEATARISYLPYELVGEKLNCVGISVLGGDLSIEDGEVVYRGENVCMGYSEKYNDLLKGDCNKGILYTGDLGYIENGFLYITGRKFREVKINGRRINLDDVELLVKKYTSGDVCCMYENNELYVFYEESLQKEYIKKLIDIVSIVKKGIVEIKIKQIPRNSCNKVDYIKLNKYIREKLWRCECDL